MRGKIFRSLTEARSFCSTASQQGYECQLEKFFERRVTYVTRSRTVTYLRRLRRRKRRVRVSYQVQWRERRVRRVSLYRVRLHKIETWESLPAYIRRIQIRYNIPSKRVTYPREFLKFIYRPDLFWAWSKLYPPYKGLGSFVKVEVWAVISRDDNSARQPEHFIYSWSRVKGLEAGVSWEELSQIKNDLESDVMEMIEKRSDYMELHEFIGWSAYPEANWYFKTVESKRSLAKYYPSRKRRGDPQ